MLLPSGDFGDEKETTEFFSDAKAKYAPTTATDILETDGESTFLDAKKVEDDSIGTKERAETSRKRVTRELTEFSERRKTDGSESDNSAERSFAISGGKVKPD